jgi:hypothetical protein
MEQYDFFYKLALIIEGDTEKLSQFKMPPESINNKTLGLMNNHALFTLAHSILLLFVMNRQNKLECLPLESIFQLANVCQ